MKQSISKAIKVVWICDGGKGFWGVFEAWMKLPNVTAILDFYHATENLGNAAKAWLDGRTKQCHAWFLAMRHKLRHGQESVVISELKSLLDSKKLPLSAIDAIRNLYHYLDLHRKHINYQKFRKEDRPIGSGLAESACKWLIQQRFKGVGMRWSEEGFTALLYIRVAWVNNRFDDFFTRMEPYPPV
jgi:hypothetical protein